MTDVEVVRRLLRYDRLAFDSFLQSVQRRGWRTASKNRELGHGSMKNTLVHVLNVHEWLLVGVCQGRNEVWDPPGHPPESLRSWADLRQYRDLVWKEVEPLYANLTSARLNVRLKLPLWTGTWLPGKHRLEDVVFQSSFEQAHHLGEILAVFRQMDWPPPQMMWLPTLVGSRAGVG